MESVVSPSASLRPLRLVGGRVERRFAGGFFRSETEASLYLEAGARTRAKAKASAKATANTGSLHCAMDGEAVHSSGRDDEFFSYLV